MRTCEQIGTSHASRTGITAILGGTRRWRFLVVLFLGLALAAGLGAGGRWGTPHIAAAQGVQVDQVIIYVDWEAGGANDGSSWDDAFVDLQLALEAPLQPDDQIWVAAGVYLPSVEHGGTGPRFQSFQMVNGVGIFGGFDPTVGDVDWEDRDWVANETILSGNIGDPEDFYDNSYHVFYHDETLGLGNSAILDGFTISDGNADAWTGVDDNGAGMLNLSASPTVANCTFENNEAWDKGAGMYNELSSSVILDCTFRSNSAWFDGGGLFNEESPVTVERTTFVDNWAWGVGGGAVNHNASPSYTDCLFLDNEAEEGGAGMMNWGGNPTVTNCTFLGNVASLADWGEGGAVGNSGSSPIMTNCTFALNHAAFTGGGMVTYGGAPILTNCTFYGNSTDGEGGAVYSYENGSPTLVNSILWGDTPDEFAGGGSPAVTYSDVQGGFSGEGNIDEDPMFVDPGNGDYHLTGGSLCIDAGTNDAPELPPFDFEGHERIVDGDGDGLAVVDMGVDEYLIPITGLQATNDSPTMLGSTTTLEATVETGSLVEYTWDLGDGTFDAGEVVLHVYPDIDVYTAVVTATNPLGEAWTETVVTITPAGYPIYLPLILSNQ